MSLVGIWVILAIALIGAAEAGYRIRAAFPARETAQNAQATGLMVSATLALLTLLTAFTFNVANSRYDARRVLAVDEANAISTAFRWQRLLSSTEGTRLAPLMRDYVTTRRDVLAHEADDPDLLRADRRTSALQAQILSVTIESLETPEGNRISTPLLAATNEMFNRAASARAAIEARIPPRQISVMLLFALGAAAMIGAALASFRARLPLSSSLMFVLFALAFTLIRDIDTSSAGGVRTPLAALDLVVQQITESQGLSTGGPGRRDAR